MKRSSVVFLVLTILSACFFILNSLANADMSSSESGRIVEFLVRHFFKGASPQDVVTLTIIVRKLAHFTEFAAFFSFFNCLMYSLTRYKNKALIFVSLFMGVFAPLIDETVQYLSPGRTSMVYDIWIDFAGCVFGMIISTLIYRFASSRYSRKRRGELASR